MFNGSMFGWGGHNPSGGARGGVSQVFNRVVRCRNVSRLLKYVQIWGEMGEVLLDENNISNAISATQLYYPENVIIIDISREFTRKKINLIAFAFRNLTDFGVTKVEVVPWDTNLVSNRPMSMLSPFLEGHAKLEPKVIFTERHYNVELEQMAFLDCDSCECADYPTKQFTTFGHCDLQFQRERLRALVPEDYLPPWLEPDTASQLPMLVPSAVSVQQWVWMLYAGVTPTSCRLPCTTTTVRTKFKFEKRTADWADGINGGVDWVVLTLPESLRRTETRRLPFSLGRLLSTLGGSLGLWLGLGLLQLGALLCPSPG
jgi:hypothetical protein